MDGWREGWMDGQRDGGTEKGTEGQGEGGMDGWTDERNFSIFYSDGVNQVSRFCLSQIQTAEF